MVEKSGFAAGADYIEGIEEFFVAVQRVNLIEIERAPQLRSRALGFDARSFDPLGKGYGPLFNYLDTLQSTVVRVAAGQFTREAIAVVKNRQFIEFCEHAGDRETAAMYRDVIEPDERYHHELGRMLLLRLAITPEAQAAAAAAARKTLELADELQRKALATAGIHHAPGC